LTPGGFLIELTSDGPKRRFPARYVILFDLDAWHRWRRRNDEEFKAYHDVSRNQRIAVGAVYLALIVVLVAGMDASYIHRTL